MTYFEGFIVPVPEANREAYRKHAADAAPIFLDIGVKRHFEAWDTVAVGSAEKAGRPLISRPWFLSRVKSKRVLPEVTRRAASQRWSRSPRASSKSSKPR